MASLYTIKCYKRVYIGIKDLVIRGKRTKLIVWTSFKEASRFSSAEYAQEFIDKNRLLHSVVLEVSDNEMRNTD